MKPIKIESKDPYTEIANIIDDWCRKNFYDSFVVTLSRDGQIITEYLEFDGGDFDFIWGNDWYEGEKDIILIGFMPMQQLRVFGAGETNYDKLRAMTMEELANSRTLCPYTAQEGDKCDKWIGSDDMRNCAACALDWLKQEAKG